MSGTTTIASDHAPKRKGMTYRLIDRLDAAAVKHLTALAKTVRAAWRSCCKHDRIPMKSKFVIFSDDNPFMPFYHKAQDEYFKAFEDYFRGGYVGLKMKNGRAVLED